MATLFFSYSHRDEALRNELETHLSQLKNEGIITAWHDRRIGAGNEFGGQISKHLDAADIILLLVSPYFLASKYCYDVEMRRAMERHDQGTAHVIPVILHPCDWHTAPFGKLLAVPTDGKPISKYANQHDALLEVARAVRAAASELQPARPTRVSAPTPASSSAKPTHRQRSSNLRVRKAFTDRERDTFLEESFQFIANYFEESLAEIQRRNPELSTKFRRLDANQFTAAIYLNGTLASQCKIWMRVGERSFGDIFYSCTPSNDNSYNESFTLEDDGFSLFLKAWMGAVLRGGRENLLTQEGAGGGSVGGSDSSFAVGGGKGRYSDSMKERSSCLCFG